MDKNKERDILSSAYQIMEKEGVEAVSVSKIKRQLPNTSTRSIYALFKDMRNLKQEVITEAGKHFDQYLSAHGKQLSDIAIANLFLAFINEYPGYKKTLLSGDAYEKQLNQELTTISQKHLLHQCRQQQRITNKDWSILTIFDFWYQHYYQGKGKQNLSALLLRTCKNLNKAKKEEH